MSGRPLKNTRDGKAELVEATAQLLMEATDSETISVAAIVERAQCTPPVLYHHFADKNDLLRVAAASILDAVSAKIDAAASAVADPVESLLIRASAYFDFADATPAAYRVLMMGGPRGPASADSIEPGSGLADLIAAVEAALTAERSDEAFGVSFGLWGIMHGLSSIHVSNPVIPSDFVRDTLDQCVRAYLRGHGIAPAE